MIPNADTPRIVFPKDLDEACRLQANPRTRGRLIAGGTDLMAQWAAGVPVPERLVSLKNLPELTGIAVTPDLVEIGAATTHAAIRDDARLRPLLPALVAASSSVGARQIQATGTLGGNAANASPAGDTAPALLVTGGLVLLASVRGPRTVPLDQFWTGYRQTAAAPDEIIVSFLLPPRGRAKETFRKVGTRAAQAISKIMIATRVLVKKGAIEHAAVAMGSVAATPVRLTALEQWLQGRPLTESLPEEAAAVVRETVHPIDDIRSTADYRRWAAGQLAADALRALL
ncbi:MAG: FAD binding domain-containing protein [Kiritimatiellae bacterium]|nr:FAD binding domain-containing protein [Kiritimatiellia bacterium]